ncbi:extracellular solute-binding protein [Methylophilus sp. 5]|uniref:extracellular solute-binding protein n=1 Tax=Methylophilus sp. 5 TaxID=1112274 RepID=UPI0004B7A1E2|nr:extracellular solute-binding protein [Methylophilus sp. 5]
MVLSFVTGVLLPMDSALSAHAVAQFGEPKYPADFKHFDYANPNAPKRGQIRFAVISQNSGFDKLNPFSLKGKPAPGLIEQMFETLTVYSLDEINTQYGLLADDIKLAPDFSAVTFHINPLAKFSNGDPLTAKEVKYSFETLTSPSGNPRFKAYFAEIKAVTMIDAHTVLFEFKRKGRDLSFVAGSLPVFSPKWGLQPDGSRVPFNKIGLEAPITSGPYVIERAVSGQAVTYRRNPNYWGANIPARRGTYNFERVVYRIYKDTDTMVAALRAGDFDFLSENKMRYWCCQYIGKRFDQGELVKALVPHQNPVAMNGWIVNLRREKFKDARVRQALNYAMDFEFMNQKIFDNEFKRVNSYFAYSPLAATGVPSAEELAILEPYRQQLPAEVFGPMLQQPNTTPPGSVRQSLTKALALLGQAGWHNRDGVLRNAKGEPFVIEVTFANRGQTPYMDPVCLNMTKLGMIVVKRVSDAATARSQMNKFDYDYTTIALREGRMPGAELWRNFNSQDADKPGAENLIGVKSAVVDALIQKLLNADSQHALEVAAHALDRVLIHSHYVIPWRYLTKHYLIYHHRLQRPEVLPKYYGAQEWALAYWWDSDAAKK